MPNIARKDGRGTGRTMNALRSMPPGGVYVWCNSTLDYPKRLAKVLNRSDVQIVSPDWLSNGRYHGTELSGICLDHALRMNDILARAHYAALLRVRSAA